MEIKRDMKLAAIVRVLALLLVMFVANPQQQLVFGNPEIEQIGDEAIANASAAITALQEKTLIDLSDSVAGIASIGDGLNMQNPIQKDAFMYGLATVTKKNFFSEFSLPVDSPSFGQTILEQIVTPCLSVDNHLSRWYDLVITQPTTPTRQAEWRIVETICRYFHKAGLSEKIELFVETVVP